MRKFSVLAVSLLLVLAASCSSDGSDGGGEAKSTTTSADGESGNGSTTAAPSSTTPATNPDGSRPTEAYVAALATGLSAEQPSAPLRVSAEQAECIAPKWVDTIGEEQFLGVDPVKLSDGTFDFTSLDLDGDQAAAMIDGYPDCGADLISAFVGFASQDFDAPTVSCLKTELARVDIRGLLISLLVDPVKADTTYGETMTGIAATCNLDN